MQASQYMFCNNWSLARETGIRPLGPDRLLARYIYFCRVGNVCCCCCCVENEDGEGCGVKPRRGESAEHQRSAFCLPFGTNRTSFLRYIPETTLASPKRFSRGRGRGDDLTYFDATAFVGLVRRLLS